MALAFVLIGLLAYEAPQPSKEQKDQQSSFEPRSQPGAGQKFLEKFVGDWEVVKSFYPRSGIAVSTKGECRQTMIHGGRFLQSEFVFGSGDDKTTGLGIIGFETATGKFTSVWTDARSTRMSLRQSRSEFDGAQIVLYGCSLNEEGKNERQSRTVTRLEDEGRKLLHRQYIVEADGKERLIMELAMTRKPASAEKKP
jgi:hypothetical protein